jgi:hypothetical protein
MFSRSGSHFRHNVVAYLALFFALGGTAIAAKPMITGADVQDGSLTGADVSDDSTLKGLDIDESDLGKVPSAQNADNVASADTLDGMDSSRLARFGGVINDLGQLEHTTGGFTVDRPDRSKTVISFPPGTFSGCHVPIVTVTPAAAQSAQTASVFRPECADDGSASFIVFIQVSTTHEFVESGFSFIAL